MTHVERGIAIGILVQEAHLHIDNGKPSVAVIFNREETMLTGLLVGAFGGKVSRNSWIAEGRECRRVLNEVIKYLPACSFLREILEWSGKTSEWFQEPARTKRLVDIGEWVQGE